MFRRDTDSSLFTIIYEKLHHLTENSRNSRFWQLRWRRYTRYVVRYSQVSDNLQELWIVHVRFLGSQSSTKYLSDYILEVEYGATSSYPSFRCLDQPNYLVWLWVQKVVDLFLKRCCDTTVYPPKSKSQFDLINRWFCDGADNACLQWNV